MSYNAFSLYCKTRIDYISGMFKGLLWFDKWNETNWKYEHLRGVPRWIFTPFAMRSNPLLYLEEGLCLCCLQLLVYYMNDNIKLEKDDFWVPMRKFWVPLWGILSPHEESNLRPLDSALRCSGIRRSEVRFLMDSESFLCLTLVTRRKTSFSISSPCYHLPSLLFYCKR